MWLGLVHGDQQAANKLKVLYKSIWYLDVSIWKCSVTFLGQDLVNVWNKYLVKIFETDCVLSSLADNGLFIKIKRKLGRACCLLSIQWTTSWGQGYIKLKYQNRKKKNFNIFFAFLHSLTHASRLLNCLKRMGMLEMRWNAHWSIVHCALPYFSVVFVSFTNLPPGQQSWWRIRRTW